MAEGYIKHVIEDYEYVVIGKYISVKWKIKKSTQPYEGPEGKGELTLFKRIDSPNICFSDIRTTLDGEPYIDEDVTIETTSLSVQAGMQIHRELGEALSYIATLESLEHGVAVTSIN